MKNYRRPLLILLLCILVVGLTGCSNDTTVEGSNNTEKDRKHFSVGFPECRKNWELYG